MIQFQKNLYTETHSYKEAAEDFLPQEGDILGSEKISGIEIRLSHVIIKDNKTPKIFPFPGLSKVYFMTVVVSDIENQALSLDLKSFEKVDDGDALSIDKTLFYWKKDKNNKAPSQIHVMTSLLKSKQALRNVGKIMRQIQQDEGYVSLAEKLVALFKDSKSKKLTQSISSLVFSLSEIVGNYLGKVDDKPLLTWFQSFTDLDGDWDKEGKTVKHAENNYVAMDLSITIRDKKRQEAAEAAV